jgi:hypothetical protein
MKQTLWIAAICVLLGTAATAQEQALNLTLLKTFIRTQNDSFNLMADGTEAFLPTKVRCPASANKGCTLKIEISGTFTGISGYSNNAMITVMVSDGSGLPGIDPAPSITTCPNCGVDDTRTFQWM